MLRCGACLAALALAAVIPSPAFADEVEDFMKQADEARYSPAQSGLKDLKVEVDTGDPTMASLKIHLFWKAPDKSASKVEGAEGPMASIAGMLQDKMKALIPLCIVPQTFEQKSENMTFELSKDGDLMKLVGTPKPGSQEAEAITSATTWFDDRKLAVKVATETRMGVTAMEATYIEKDGKFLLETMDGHMGPQPMKLRFVYAQVEGVWLPETMKQEAMGTSATMSFVGYEVNKGLDDSLFDSAAKNKDK